MAEKKSQVAETAACKRISRLLESPQITPKNIKLRNIKRKEKQVLQKATPSKPKRILFPRKMKSAEGKFFKRT